MSRNGHVKSDSYNNNFFVLCFYNLFNTYTIKAHIRKWIWHYYLAFSMPLAYFSEVVYIKKQTQRDFKEQTERKGSKACFMYNSLPSNFVTSREISAWIFPDQNKLEKCAKKTDTWIQTQTTWWRLEEKHNLFLGKWCCAAIKFWCMGDKTERELLPCESSSYLWGLR